MEPLKTKNLQSFSIEPFGAKPVTTVFSKANIDQARLTKGTKKADCDRCLLIGFDTEYQTYAAVDRDTLKAKGARNDVLSYQFCIKLLDQGRPAEQSPEVSGIVVPAEGARIALQDFVSFAIGSLIAQSPTLQLPSDVYLVGHFTRADMPAFAEFTNFGRKFLTSVRNTFVSIDSFIPVRIVDSADEQVANLKLHLRDTLLLAPANAKSLADIGEIVGLEKIRVADSRATEIEIKQNMRRFRDSEWQRFRDYAIRDAQVCVRYAEKVIRQFSELFIDFKLPLTLTQFGTRLVLDQWDGKGLKADDVLGREEVKEKVFSKSLGYPIEKVTHPYIEEVYFDVPFATETYHGGRNEQFEFGISPEGDWRDHDLSSAYTTAMSMIGLPNWRKTVRLTDFGEDSPVDLAFYSVDFEFPPGVRFPVLPVRTSSGIIFPLTGRSFCAAPEVYLARRLGAKLHFRRGVRVPMDRLRPVFRDFISSSIQKRAEHPKNSFENLFWKEVGNSTYGKTAQGLRKKRVFDLRSDDMVELPESPLTQPFFASFITSFTRAVLGEILNGFPREVRVFSVTTDGFLSTATDSQIATACSGRLFEEFSRARLTLDGSAQPLEIKHRICQPLGWRTRGSATLKAGEDERMGIVLQKGGIKTPELMDLPEQNQHVIELFLNRRPEDKINYTIGIGLKDMIHHDTDFVSRAVTKRLSMEFDWKRVPLNAEDRSVCLPNGLRTHLSFETTPHRDIQSFQTMRDAWEKFDSKPRRNLKTLLDLQRFLNFVETRSYPEREVARYLSREDGDIKRLRRDLCRAFVHGAAGLDLVRSRSKYVYKGFAAVLTACGIPCRESDLDNGKRSCFVPHQTIPTYRVVDALNKLKTGYFAELEVDQILAMESGPNPDVGQLKLAA